jgi:hypothetical protein
MSAPPARQRRNESYRCTRRRGKYFVQKSPVAPQRNARIPTPLDVRSGPHRQRFRCRISCRRARRSRRESALLPFTLAARLNRVTVADPTWRLWTTSACVSHATSVDWCSVAPLATSEALPSPLLSNSSIVATEHSSSPLASFRRITGTVPSCPLASFRRGA